MHWMVSRSAHHAVYPFIVEMYIVFVIIKITSCHAILNGRLHWQTYAMLIY